MTLLEKYIFNAAAMREIIRHIEAMSKNHSEIIAGEQGRLLTRLDEVSAGIEHITSVIMKGIVSPALTGKLEELEQEKAQIESEMRKLSQNDVGNKTADVDPLLIPQQYVQLKKRPSSPTYKEFIQGFIKRIEVGRYGITITIKTGLDIFSELDTILTVRRQEIYEQGSGF